MAVSCSFLVAFYIILISPPLQLQIILRDRPLIASARPVSIDHFLSDKNCYLSLLSRDLCKELEKFYFYARIVSSSGLRFLREENDLPLSPEPELFNPFTLLLSRPNCLYFYHLADGRTEKCFESSSRIWRTCVLGEGCVAIVLEENRKAVEVWNIVSKRRLCTLKLPALSAMQLRRVPSRSEVAAVTTCNVYIFSIQTRELAGSYQLPPAWLFVEVVDRYLFYASMDGELFATDLLTRRLKWFARLLPQKNDIPDTPALSLTPCGHLLQIHAEVAILRDMETGAVLRSYPEQSGERFLYKPVADKLLLAVAGSDSVQIWSLSNPENENPLRVLPARVRPLKIFRSLIITIGMNGDLQIWHPRASEPVLNCALSGLDPGFHEQIRRCIVSHHFVVLFLSKNHGKESVEIYEI